MCGGRAGGSEDAGRPEPAGHRVRTGLMPPAHICAGAVVSTSSRPWGVSALPLPAPHSLESPMRHSAPTWASPHRMPAPITRRTRMWQGKSAATGNPSVLVASEFCDSAGTLVPRLRLGTHWPAGSACRVAFRTSAPTPHPLEREAEPRRTAFPGGAWERGSSATETAGLRQLGNSPHMAQDLGARLETRPGIACSSLLTASCLVGGD
jgi:hypothetical protein